MHDVAKTLNKIGDELNKQFLERADVIEACKLAVLVGEHVYILGPPGTAKSNLIRALVDRFTGATYFETVMSRTRPAQAVLGQYDMEALKQSRFVRKGDGYVQSVDFAMLDEIGKMSAILGHDLLPILNERLYHEVDNGRSAHKAPLWCAFTASNELIVNESDDAAALWDRLLIRTVVDYLHERGSFSALLRGTEPKHVTTLPYADLRAAAEEVANIPLTRDGEDAIVTLRDTMHNSGFVVSDRRWRQSVKLMQASAFIDGRSQIETDDVAALRFALWETPEQIAPVERMCLTISNPAAEKLLEIEEAFSAIRRGITEREGKAGNERAQYGVEANGKIKLLTGELQTLLQQARTEGRSTARFDRLEQLRRDTQVDIYVKCLDMDPAVAASQT